MSNEHNISVKKLKITTNRYISVSQKTLMSTITDRSFKLSFTWSTLVKNLTSALNITFVYIIYYINITIFLLNI